MQEDNLFVGKQIAYVYIKTNLNYIHRFPQKGIVQKILLSVKGQKFELCCVSSEFLKNVEYCKIIVIHSKVSKY